MPRIRKHKVVALEPDGSIDLKGAELLWADAPVFSGGPSLTRMFWPGGIFFARRNPAYALYRTTDGTFVIKDGIRSGQNPIPNRVLDEYLKIPRPAIWPVYRVVSGEEAAEWLKTKSPRHARRLSPMLTSDQGLPDWVVCPKCGGDGCERCDQSGFVEARHQGRLLHA
jgi:hypothetical protein